MKGSSDLLMRWFIGFAAFVFGMSLGSAIRVSIMQAEAVKRGHAEYVPVNNGPETKFQWKEGIK